MGSRTLLDALTDLVVVVGADGRVSDMGAAARSFLGDRPAGAGTPAARGAGGEITETPHLRDLVEVVDPAFRLALGEAVTTALARTGQWRGSVGLVDLTGATVPHHLTVRVDPGGGLVIVARDTSDQRAREVAENDSRAKDELIARLGHELRTPLNAMLGFAQLLELEPLTPDLHDDVERIITGGRHMQALIDDVLDLARLRAGRGDINKGPVNVLDIVQGVVELVEPLAAQRSIRRVIHPAVPLVADADRRRLWQVLLNLVGNALKYGREGGSVRVGIVPVTGSRIRIEVEDDGAGLSPRAIDRLFRPFERLGAERSGIEGSGLGLALSHALVTAMGGVLTVASRHGVGSLFAVVLDAVDTRFEYDDDIDDRFDDGFGDAFDGGARGAVETYGGSVRFARRSPAAGLRVVHVSGDPALRATVTEALAAALAADTVTVPRAGLALEAVRRARPAFVLLDRDLPDAAATELLTQLAADPVTGGVPVLVLTEDTDPRERARLCRAGAVDILGIPLDPDALVAAATALTAAMTPQG